jgi:hypothetical protein
MPTGPARGGLGRQDLDGAELAYPVVRPVFYHRDVPFPARAAGQLRSCHRASPGGRGEGRAHVSVIFNLGAACRFIAHPLALFRDEQVALEDVWGHIGANLRETPP